MCNRILFVPKTPFAGLLPSTWTSGLGYTQQACGIGDSMTTRPPAIAQSAA